jgi:hypothetical protein
MSSPPPTGLGIPAELAHVQAQFLARARELGAVAPEAVDIVPTGADPGGPARGWRFDMRIALSGQSFLLTTDGRWCTAVRTGLASFGWGVPEAEELYPALEAWADDLIRSLHATPLP